MDVRAQSNLSESDLESLRSAIMNTIEFDKQPLSLLKRKGDIIARIYSKLGKTQELLVYLVQLIDSDKVKGRQFAMYAFEVMNESNITSE